MCSAHDTWIDLATRESDGITIALLWSRASGCVKIAVADARLDGGFELDVPRADALAAFYHPFSYAAAGAARRGRTLRMSTDLQLQS
jgi:hypothetical protein